MRKSAENITQHNTGGVKIYILAPSFLRENAITWERKRTIASTVSNTSFYEIIPL